MMTKDNERDVDDIESPMTKREILRIVLPILVCWVCVATCCGALYAHWVAS